MSDGSFFKGLVGIAVLLAGIGFLLSSFAYGVVALAFNFFHLDASFLGTLSIIGALIGIFLSWLGLKWFFESDDELLEKLIGVVGILLVLLGFIAAIAGLVTAGSAWIATLMLWAMGLAFIAYGFDIEVLSFFKKLLELVKDVVV